MLSCHPIKTQALLSDRRIKGASNEAHDTVRGLVCALEVQTLSVHHQLSCSEHAVKDQKTGDVLV